MKIQFLSIILFLLFQFTAFAQYDDLEFEHITIADGLPDDNVRWIFQDHLGFMWFGTDNGFVKYDGYKMTVYKEDVSDTTMLLGALACRLAEDNNNNLWLGHSKGLSLLDRENEKFISYFYDPDNKEPYANVYNPFKDHRGRLWIYTQANGILTMSLDSSSNNTMRYKVTKHYLPDSSDTTSIPEKCIADIYESREKQMWFGGFWGLSRYNEETDNFTTYNVLKERKASFTNAVTSIFQSNTDDIWFATWGDSEAFGILNPETGEVEYISLHSTELDYLHKDRVGSSNNCINGGVFVGTDGSFWVPTVGGGLIHFYPSTRNFKYYINNPDNPESISSFNNTIWSIYKDFSGVLWIGTNGGVNKLTNSKSYIQHIKYHEIFPEGLTNKNKIHQIFEDSRGVLWLGTLYGGLISFNRKSGEKKQYLHDPNNPFSICDNTISHIIEDKEGFLWIGTINGLSKYDRDQNKFFNFYHTPGDTLGLPDNSVSCLYEDAIGDIYVGNEAGVLCKYIKSKSNFINYFKIPVDYTELVYDTLGHIGEIRIDNEGIVWFSSGANLNKFDPEKGLVKKYYFDVLSGGGNAATLFIDSKGRFWMGRKIGGLLRFDKKTENYRIYSKKNGLTVENVGSILEDDEGNLWFRTGTSICRFSSKDETIREIINLTTIHPFIYGAYRSKITGEMYFEGDDGIYVFHPDSIKDNTVPPKVVLTDFKVFDQSVQIGEDSPLKKHINVAKEITLNYWQNDFTFEFAALHYVNPGKNQYKYIMDGYDEDWRKGDISRLAHYTNMSPGEYSLRVIASNSDGVWNEEGASIKIIILPPWWATTWSYLVYTFLILSMIYFTWKLQVKRIRIKHEYEMSRFEADKMHEVDELKSRFFANISHEFRTPLTLIFGPAKDIAQNCDDKNKVQKNAGIISRNATRLYDLVNQLLDLSKLEAGKMKLEASEQNIIPLLKGLVLSFTSLSERKKIELKFNSTAENLNVYIDKDKVEKIINNLLSNAFKFTAEGGKIEFAVEKLINELEIRITDDGIGIPEGRIGKIFDRFYQADSSHTREGEGTGIGLALTKELVELHKGKIKVESIEGGGTTFTLQLPLGKDHLKPEEIVGKPAEEINPEIEELPKPVPETENRKEKTEIDVLLDTDKPLLLIVEDNPDVRSYIISHLEEDYRIQEAVDGEDGLEQAVNHIPDLIISDVMMPKMDGFDMCNKLKTDEKTSHIPIIMLTAKATSKDKIEGYETGADDYIMKPFDAAELKVRIKNLIEIRRKLQEKFSSDGFKLPKELSSIDEQFMKRVLKAINDHISEEEFSIEELGKEAAISRVYLHRKLKALTGKSPSLFIRSIRLSRAKRLLTENGGTVAEVAYNFGFGSPAYFTKCFKEEFGCLPSELIR